MQLFNLFKKKPEKKYISFNEEVEDVIVTFRLRNLKSVRKTFKGGYEELKRFMKDWRQDGSACFDEYIIRFDDLFIGEIEVVYHDTNKPEHCSGGNERNNDQLKTGDLSKSVPLAWQKDYEKIPILTMPYWLHHAYYGSLFATLFAILLVLLTAWITTW